MGGIKARRAAKKANAQLDRTEKENQAWYDRKYNEDYTQGAMAQAANATNGANQAMAAGMGLAGADIRSKLGMGQERQ